MFFDIYTEEFKKNFKPSFREEKNKTFCVFDGEDILYKDETSGEYIWLKEYPQEIKNFILSKIKDLMVAKILMADYYLKENKVVTHSGQELSQFDLYKTSIFEHLKILGKDILPVVAERKIGQGYLIKPIFKFKNNGFTFEDIKKLVLATMTEISAGVVSPDLSDKYGYLKPVTDQDRDFVKEILNTKYKNYRIAKLSRVQKYQMEADLILENSRERVKIDLETKQIMVLV